MSILACGGRYNSSRMTVLSYESVGPRRARHALRWGILCCVLLVVGSMAIPSVVPARKSIVERLNSPVPVSGWTSAGVQLANGRTVQWRDVSAVDLNSSALAEVAQNGVEVAPDGRIFGLIRVHHWCGNDPIGQHIARVDIERLLFYRGEGKTTNRAWTRALGDSQWARSHSEWDPGDQIEFRAVEQLIDAELAGSQ